MKKGFTLIEILAVVVLLGVIGLIVTVSVDKILSENKQKAYDLQIEEIKQGASRWANKNVFDLPDDNQSMIITVGELKKQGFLAEELINPLTKEPFSNNLQIKISSINNTYTYEIIE